MSAELQDAVTLAQDLQPSEHFVARIQAHIDVSALLRALDAGLDPDMVINDQLESVKAGLSMSLRMVLTEAKALAVHLDRLEANAKDEQ